MKMTVLVKALVDQQMRDDNETIALQLHTLLLRYVHTMTLKTVLRCRAALGWTFRGSANCQLIHQQNKVKHLQWAQEHLSDGFDNVIWTDAKRVQRSSNRARIVLHGFIQRRIVL